MLLDLIRGNSSDGFEILISFLTGLFVIFCTMPIHEYAHARVATLLGDKTPKLSGRLSLNPLAHISPIGAVMIFLCGFGYAKPVNVNPRNFKNPKLGMALTAIAGPVSNLIMGFIFVFFSVMIRVLFNIESSPVIYAINIFVSSAAIININLAVFNLLPIPPLDGSRVLQLLIPGKYYYKFLQYERYITIVVILLIMTPILTDPLSLMSGFISGLFEYISRWIVYIILFVYNLIIKLF